MTVGATLDPRRFRSQVRSGTWKALTAGCCQAYEQANLVVLPEGLSREFLQFCQGNPKACPLIEITDPGDPEPRRSAPGADLRTDVPRYRVYRDGRLDQEVSDILEIWRDDLVGFLLGCSFTFDAALQRAGIPVRHLQEGKNVPMYVTGRQCEPAGIFSGPLVVSMRPIVMELVRRAIVVTRRYPMSHGTPVHVGDPEAIGIRDLDRPDYGDAVSLRPGETPVFWACGVTPQAVALEAKPELMIAHAPGHMFVTDLEAKPILRPGLD